MTNNPRARRVSAAPPVPRRRRGLAWLALVLLVGLPTMVGGAPLGEPFVGARLGPDGLEGPDGLMTGVTASRRLGEPPVIATVSGVELLSPSADPVIVGFHEASFDDAMAFVPVGMLATNDNTTKFTNGIDDVTGFGYVIQASRGRAHSAVSAVDVLLEPGVSVLSPVNGRVTDVRNYDLYGRYADTRIEIQPDAAPHLRVVMIHVRGVRVQVGQRVTAGISEIAAEANAFGFESQIDRYAARAGLGHVHIEVKPPGGAAGD